MLLLGLVDTAEDGGIVYASLSLSLVTVAAAIADKVLHVMDAEPGWLELAAVYLGYVADAVSRTVAVGLLFALDTSGRALGLAAAGIVLVDLAAQAWQNELRRNLPPEDPDCRDPLEPESWREVDVCCGGVKLGIGLREGCCDCEHGPVDYDDMCARDGCICTACSSGPGRLLCGPIAMLQRHGRAASVPGAVLSLFGALPISNRKADHDRVAMVAGLATTAVAVAALASVDRLEAKLRDGAGTGNGTTAKGDPVDPTLAAALCLAALAVRLVVHAAVVRRIELGNGAVDVAGITGIFAVAVDARGQMGSWTKKDWEQAFAAERKIEVVDGTSPAIFAKGLAAAVEAGTELSVQRLEWDVNFGRNVTSTMLEGMCHLVRLTTLGLRGCSSLTTVPETIGNLVQLTTLHLFRCSSLTSVPATIGNLVQLTMLDLSECSSLTSVPETIGNLVQLTMLDMRGCSSLTSVPETVAHVATTT